MHPRRHPPVLDEVFLYSEARPSGLFSGVEARINPLSIRSKATPWLFVNEEQEWVPLSLMIIFPFSSLSFFSPSASSFFLPFVDNTFFFFCIDRQNVKCARLESLEKEWKYIVSLDGIEVEAWKS